MRFAALNVKNTYLFYVLCRFLVLISAFLYLFPFLSGKNMYYLFRLALQVRLEIQRLQSVRVYCLHGPRDTTKRIRCRSRECVANEGRETSVAHADPPL